LLVDSVERMMMHGLGNPKPTVGFYHPPSNTKTVFFIRGDS